MALQAGPADGGETDKDSISQNLTNIISPGIASSSPNTHVYLLSSADPMDKEEHPKPWHCLPDSLLFEIFRFLGAEDVTRAGGVCASWNRVSHDPFLWRNLFCYRWQLPSRNYGPTPSSVSSFSTFSSSSPSSSSLSSSSSSSSSWRNEFIRLETETPSTESEVYYKHSDEVLHVSFSPDGNYFATTSKDANVMVRVVFSYCSCCFLIGEHVVVVVVLVFWCFGCCCCGACSEFFSG